VSLWDMRTGVHLQSFKGHLSAVNHVTFNKKGDTLLSTDAEGVYRVWDIRMVTERASFDTGL
jgi:WD40 repeat protein